jgi:hypothetical protein
LSSRFVVETLGVQPAILACDDSVPITAQGNAGMVVADFGFNGMTHPVALFLKE